MDERDEALARLTAALKKPARPPLDPDEQRKRRRRYFFGGLALAALLIGARGALDPWSLSWPGRPSLTGRWVGELSSPSGVRFIAFLDIRWGGGDRCGNCSRIDGVAASCRADGDRRSYRLTGDADTWRGDRFHLRLTQDIDDSPGLRLFGMNGVWRGDQLDMSGVLASLLKSSDPVQAADTDRETTWTMRRGGKRDFETACSKLIGPAEI